MTIKDFHKTQMSFQPQSQSHSGQLMMPQGKMPTDRSHNPWNLMGPSVGSTEDVSQQPVSTWRGGKKFRETYKDALSQLRDMETPETKFYTQASAQLSKRPPTLDPINDIGNQEICIETLPKSLYISSRKEERSMQFLKDSYMRNKFDHLNFN